MTDEEFDKARKEKYQPTCRWYVTEDKNDDYIRCSEAGGFCLIQDFFTCCLGKCESYTEN